MRIRRKEEKKGGGNVEVSDCMQNEQYGVVGGGLCVRRKKLVGLVVGG